MFKIIKDNYRVLTFQFGCTIIAVSFGAIIGTYIELAQYDDKIFKNISVGEVALECTSESTALEMVQEQYTSDFENIDFVISSNIEEAINTAYTYSKELSIIDRYKYLTNRLQKDFEINYTYNDDAIATFINKFINDHSQESANASITISTKGDISITKEVNGIKFDKALLTDAVYKALSPQKQVVLEAQNNIINVDVTPFITSTEPLITSKSLSTIDTLLTSVSTNYTRGTGSDVNIAVAARTLNGTLVMPGDTFSYNELIGNTTLEKGYTYAPVIVNSQITQGVGGGVCQVSSTLYNAILNIGLLPVERKPHSRPSSYLPLGLDAAIDWGNIDFKFVNTLPYPIYITSYTKNNKVFTDIYSNKTLLNSTYKLRSEVQQVLESTTKYITDSSLPAGTKKLQSTGSTGYTVKVIRDTYFKENLQATEVLYYDTYSAIPTIYRIN